MYCKTVTGFIVDPLCVMVVIYVIDNLLDSLFLSGFVYFCVYIISRIPIMIYYHDVERYQQRVSVENNPKNSTNPKTHTSLDDFFALYQHVFNAGMSTLTFTATLLGLRLAFEALQLQREAIALQEELIRATQEAVKSTKALNEANRLLADALNQSKISQNYSDKLYRIVNFINDLAQIGRTVLEFKRFFTKDNKDGRPSGTRDIFDFRFETPPGAAAFKERNRSRSRSYG